jgi:hypothetical protein
MIKLVPESTLSREVYYCPGDGRFRERLTMWEPIKEVASPIIAAVAITNLLLALHGHHSTEPLDAGEFGDITHALHDVSDFT